MKTIDTNRALDEALWEYFSGEGESMETVKALRHIRETIQKDARKMLQESMKNICSHEKV